MEDQITVNGRVFSIRRLLGKGKGGYSYLAADEHGEYVVKQIHHEPCEYYQFGDKLAAEQYDYARLLAVGIPMPRLLDVDVENERILKEYIPGSTAAELIAENRLPGFLSSRKQLRIRVTSNNQCLQIFDFTDFSR